MRESTTNGNSDHHYETSRIPSLRPDRTDTGDSGAPDLEEQIRTQIRKWQSKLLDLGNRNPLINCSFNASRGVVEIAFPDAECIWRRMASEGAAGSTPMRFPWRRLLVPPPPGHDEEEVSDAGEPIKAKKEWNPPLAECRASRKLGDRDLLTGIGDGALERRLRTLDGHAHLSLSEQGVHCLFIAFGFLRWFESVDSDVEHLSPMMLVPVSLSRASADAPWELAEAEDDAIDNLCLRERLKQDFGMVLPSLPDIDDLEEDGARQAFLEAVRKAISSSPRWEVLDRCALGRFAFPKVAMWQDLGDHAESVLAHDLCRSVGGDATIPSRRSFGLTGPLPGAAQLDDEVAPGEIKSILDCDSSQLEAIVAARRGVSFVLDGPPGTGKSQTIANIIADALSEGRRVLFVSEKVSALDVVKRRLDDCGLGDFCLECHSSKANRKAVLEELKYCLDLPVEVYDDVTPKLEEAKQRRTALNDYVRSIHRRRPPLGLSPYELYGHVSRLHRLGHAVRSRCELPSVEGMDRARFEAWLELLDRAQESTNAIKGNARHPWRGCVLTARTLTLSDDLTHHLGVLSRAFSAIDGALAAASLNGLVPSATSLGTLESVLRTLDSALTAPPVPDSWFVSPRRIATNILALHDADRAVNLYRESLDAFINGVEEVFPDERIDGLSLPPDDALWLERLRGSLPETVRRQQAFLVEPLARLRSLLDSIEVASSAAANIVEQFPIPLRPDLTPAQLSAAVDWARLVASAFPFHPKWLLSDNWPILRDRASAASVRLVRLSEIAHQLDGRLPTTQLPKLSEAIESPERLQSSWEAVRAFSPQGDAESLATLDSRLKTARSLLTEIGSIVQGVFRSLGVEGLSPSLRVSRSLASSLSHLLELPQVPGAWRDARLRSKTRSNVEAAISDLQEAAEARQQLEERLSHRAFRPAALTLAEQAQRFQSAWKRWFGGFEAYRREIAELYKGGIPGTQTMLNELLKLRAWHRRMADVSEAARSMSAGLPQPFDPDDSSSWERVRQALDTFDRFERENPELASRLPARAVTVDRPVIELARFQIEAVARQLQSTCEGTPLQALLNDETPLSELERRLTSVLDATAHCISCRGSAAGCYAASPPDVPKLVEDAILARQYVRVEEELHSLFLSVKDFVSTTFASNDLESWKRVQRGVQAAQRLSKLTASLEKHREALCEEGRLDPARLAANAEVLEGAAQKLTENLQAIAPRLSLCGDGMSADDLAKRTINELLHSARAAIVVLNARSEILISLLPSLKSDADVEIASLPEARTVVRHIRSALIEIGECAIALKELGADPSQGLTEGAQESARWLLKQVDNASITPLIQAVATSGDVRAEVAKTIESIRASMGREFSTSLKFLETVLSFSTETRRGFSIDRMPLDILSEHLTGLQTEIGTLDEWLKFSRWRRDMGKEGFEGVVEELLAGAYEPLDAKSVIAARFYRLIFDRLAQEEGRLGEFDLDAHEHSRERFRKLDEWESRAASSRIRQFQLGRDDRPRSGWFVDSTSELGILQREIQKKRRQLPLRKLFAEVPSVLQRLKPCIMMSPLSVSTFLQSDQIRFDLVIFDEASQVFPWDAIGAIYRGRQLIVAGDEKQLPPTNFFNRADLESGDEEDDDIGDYESILSLCKSIGMPGRGLRWHYRSRREPLIAFSNRHFYGGDLVTFPSTRDAAGDAVRLEHVPQGRWIDRTNIQEAERVVDLVIRHLRSGREASLGIIAFNQSQQSAIEDSIYTRRRKYPEVEALFHTGLSEPLFVKNLENVQGDERDVIILSMGYGYNEHGKFLKNFGPLTKAGGERRLNVAVTRAREEVVLVASVKATDLDLSGSTSQGAHLLKGYLEYAERGVDSLAREITSITGEAESTFEQEVAAALIRRGLHPTPQVGCGGFRIDLALKHPQRPGEFCLGIECDGATYHSSKTARDRDRIRQSVLEDLGWRIVRVWSTDWIRNPDRQLQLVLDAYEKATASDLDFDDLAPAHDEDLDDLKPRIEVPDQPTAPAFRAIKDVPEEHLRKTFESVVKRGGAIDLEGLIQQTARSLGFARTGKQIRQRLEATLNELLQVGHLRWIGERIAPRTDGQ